MKYYISSDHHNHILSFSLYYITYIYNLLGMSTSVNGPLVLLCYIFYEMKRVCMSRRSYFCLIFNLYWNFKPVRFLSTNVIKISISLLAMLFVFSSLPKFIFSWIKSYNCGENLTQPNLPGLGRRLENFPWSTGRSYNVRSKLIKLRVVKICSVFVVYNVLYIRCMKKNN